MKTFWLGAGASCSYDGSHTGVRPPLASNLFSRFFELEIAEDPHVIIGNLVNYVRDTRGLSAEQFGLFSENAEDFLTELDDVVNILAPLVPKLHKNRSPGGGVVFGNFWSVSAAYDQTVWLFARILNAIQNGDLSAEYLELIRQANPEDGLITFNWDTLLDRCLYNSGGWYPETGYGLNFLSIFDGAWRVPAERKSVRTLLKLHGSTNWLVPYLTRSLENGKRAIMVPGKEGRINIGAALAQERLPQEDGTVKIRLKPDLRLGPPYTSAPVPRQDKPAIRPLCYVRDLGPFETYRNRYKPGYSEFSYYYPPNHPITHAPTMPLLIPPTKRKLYEEFGFIFKRLWAQATTQIRNSSELILIGFSFPDTDTRARFLLADALKRRHKKLAITVVDPAAEQVIGKLRTFLPLDKFRIKKSYRSFSEYLG